MRVRNYWILGLSLIVIAAGIVSSSALVGGLNADQVDGLEASAFAQAADLQTVDTRLTTLEQQVADFDGGVNRRRKQRGVVFTRWGRSDCPGSTSLVYSGFAGGEHFTHRGSGTNTLCLTSAPTWDNFSDFNQNGALIYGTEYEVTGFGLAGVSPFNTLHNDNAPCAVCLDAEADTELMLPGSQACPSGWNTRMHGYLMAQHFTQNGSEFVCVDRNAEAVLGGEANTNGQLWYPTEAECGSLPCGTGQYVQNREITCAICTR